MEELREKIDKLSEKVEKDREFLEKLRNKVAEMELEQEMRKMELDDLIERMEELKRKDPGEVAQEKENEEEKDEDEEIPKENWILVWKGRRWEVRSLGIYVRGFVGEAGYEWKEIEGKNMGILKFQKNEDANRLWSRKDLIRGEGFYRIDEWLSEEERDTRRKMVEGARELKRLDKREKLEIKVENKRTLINGSVFIWDERSGRLVRERKEGEELWEDDTGESESESEEEGDKKKRKWKYE